MLNIFNDRDYNRSVVTIVAPIDGVGEHSFTSFLPRGEEEERQLHVVSVPLKNLL